MGKYHAIKRVELAEVMYGYDSECFALVRPATVQDRRDFQTFIDSNPTAEQSEDWQNALVASHFLQGKIKTTDDGTNFETAELTKEIIAEVVDISNVLASAIMGWSLDPKDIRKAVEESALQASADASTKTST